MKVERNQSIPKPCKVTYRSRNSTTPTTIRTSGYRSSLFPLVMWHHAATFCLLFPAHHTILDLVGVYMFDNLPRITKVKTTSMIILTAVCKCPCSRRLRIKYFGLRKPERISHVSQRVLHIWMCSIYGWNRRDKAKVPIQISKCKREVRIQARTPLWCRGIPILFTWYSPTIACST